MAAALRASSSSAALEPRLSLSTERPAEQRTASNDQPHEWLWRAYWVLPLASSAITLVVALCGFATAPRTDQDWAKALAQNVSPSKGAFPRFTHDDRIAYRVLKLVFVSLALVLDGLVLRRRWEASCCPPPAILPKAHVMLQVLRLMFACIELWLLAAFAGNVWINPGLGMFGWSYALGGMPRIGLDDTVHVLLAISAAASLALLSRRFGRGREPELLWRLLRAILLVLSLWYAIYDSKHWFAASRLSNCYGAYMMIYAPLAAASELFRHTPSRPGQSGPAAAADVQDVDPLLSRDGCAVGPDAFEAVLDWHQMALLMASVVRLAYQLHTTGFCWAAPPTYLQDRDLPLSTQRIEQFGNLWKTSVVWGLNLAGSFTLFATVELLRRHRAVDQHAGSSPQADVVGRSDITLARYS